MDVKGIQFAENDGRGRWLYRGSIEALSCRRRRRWQEGGSSHKVKSALSDSAGCWVLESGSLKSACQEGNAFHPERGTMFHQSLKLVVATSRLTKDSGNNRRITLNIVHNGAVLSGLFGCL
mmetsp:Transcript_8884/g.18722  ORF Transcript_8884/g.18722 Transcript_8884/m.18722 type:complete len:121 (-) Transcript_8884:7-369(-)